MARRAARRGPLIVSSSSGALLDERATPRCRCRSSELGRPAPWTRTRDDYIDTQVLIFRLIAGEHFDEDEIRTLAAEALARDYDPAGVLRQLMAIAASPDRTEALQSVTAPTLVIHGLPRLAGDAERRHRHGPGSARIAPIDVPRHGPRPAPESLGRDRRGDRAERRARRIQATLDDLTVPVRGGLRSIRGSGRPLVRNCHFGRHFSGGVYRGEARGRASIWGVLLTDTARGTSAAPAPGVWFGGAAVVGALVAVARVSTAMSTIPPRRRPSAGSSQRPCTSRPG